MTNSGVGSQIDATVLPKLQAIDQYDRGDYGKKEKLTSQNGIQYPSPSAG